MDETHSDLVCMTESDIDTETALVGRAMNDDEERWAARTMQFHFGCCSHGLDDGRRYYVWKQDGRLRALVGLHHAV
ncbi:MAG: hypothetical protein JSW27_15075 [Phycisphaerales bacterium]|nr:MAG: hypothetical protein JSW27_15075 [Phycisphaerales bacterium]